MSVRQILASPILAASKLSKVSASFLSKSEYSTSDKPIPEVNPKLVNVTFLKANGEKIHVKGKIGDSLLDVVVNNDLDFDGFGACEGMLTCSTCHLIFQEKDFKELPQMCDEESDMLDLAYELTNTSRLGCQVILSEKLNGLEVVVPGTINDVRE